MLRFLSCVNHLAFKGQELPSAVYQGTCPGRIGHSGNLGIGHLPYTSSCDIVPAFRQAFLKRFFGG
jgi:hypothetical protein